LRLIVVLFAPDSGLILLLFIQESLVYNLLMKRKRPSFPITPDDWLREIREAPPGCAIAVLVLFILAILKMIFFD